MDEEERAKLEKERARLEATREKLEQERERLEEQREKMEEKAEERIEMEQEKLEEAAEKIEEAVERIQERIENGIAGIDVDIDVDKISNCVSRSMEGVVKNLGILNLKNVSLEELENIREIKNLGMIIAPEKYMSQISAKVTKNLGSIVPYKEGMRLYSGDTTIEASMLDALDEPIEFLQTGRLTFSDDVTPELIKSKIKGFDNYGQVRVPTKIYGILMAKCMENHGQIAKLSTED
jgi:hypothetical protein